MTVKHLIEMLNNCDPNDAVVSYNGDSEQNESVSGMVYGGADHIVELQTDDLS
jgi:hypothetical protein